MKAGWEIKQLDDVCDVEYGTRVVQKRDGGSMYSVYGGGGATFHMDEYNREDRLVVARFAMSEQCTRFIYGRFYLNDSGLTVSPKNEVMLPRFLDYQLQALNDDIYKLARGTAQKNLDVPAFRVLKIVVPNIKSEQQRIVSILDEAFEGIATATANAEKNLANAREVFDSYLQDVFTTKGDEWAEERLEECFKLKSGDNLTSKMMSENGTYPVYGGNGIAGLHNNYNLSGNNVIIGRVGALCGNVRHISENIWLTDNAFKVVDFKYEFDESFLTYLLNFKNLRGFARQAAQPVISNSSLKDVLLQFPNSLTEQQEIVTQLDELSTETKKLESIYKQKLSALTELKKSILNKAFSGQLH